LDYAAIQSSSRKSLTVTLIGSAETLAGPTKKTTFLEDLRDDQSRAAEEAKAQQAMGATQGMIVALQLPPHRRDDMKQEMYSSNRFVTGLPQRQIEQELEKSRNQQSLQGKVAMTMGMELRRAYVNARAVHVLDLNIQSETIITPIVQSTLIGHLKDAVICLCELPNGDLLTGGGKLDTTLQLWTKSQLSTREQQDDDGQEQVHSKACKVLSDVGYVFCLAVLPDAKDAVAAARYNTYGQDNTLEFDH
jgi:WD40 repeat protein